MPHPGLLHLDPLPLWQATTDPYLYRRHSDTQRQVWLSLCGLSWCAQVLFEPSECLWRIWGLILNVIFLILLSCWASPLLLDMGYLFLVGSNILLSMVVQQCVVILEFLQEKMRAGPSTPPSWEIIT